MRSSQRKAAKPWPRRRLALGAGFVVLQLLGLVLLLRLDDSPQSPISGGTTGGERLISLHRNPASHYHRDGESSSSGKYPLCTHIRPKNETDGDSALYIIPKMRHMTWKTKILEVQKAKDIMKEWQEKEPTFGHIIHDDDECLLLAAKFSQLRAEEAASSQVMPADVRFLHPSLQRLTRRQYHFSFSQVFADFQLNIMRADTCRILVVYFYGGLYTDLDVGIQKRVHTWELNWLTHDIMIAMENHFRISNYAMAATPRHPVMRVVLEYILREGQDQLPFKRSAHAVHHTTGPAVLTAAIAAFRIHPSFLDIPLNLHTEKEETLSKEPFCSISLANSSYKLVMDAEGESWLKVVSSMDRDTLERGTLHERGSTSWGDSKGYNSWVARRDTQFKKLQEGDPVDALGKRVLWTGTRVEQNADQAFPTLFPKLRHVVAQSSSSMMAKARSSKRAWEAAEPHYTTIIHTADDCRDLAHQYNMKMGRGTSSSKNIETIPSVICGLLAVHHFGGIYMDLSVCPRVPFTDWAPKIPWDTVDMLHVSTVSEEVPPSSFPKISPLFFASTIQNHCIGQVLDAFSLDIFATADIIQHVSYGFSTCSKLVDSIAKEWDVHYINGYKKEECLRSWVESEGGGRSIQDNYRLLTSNATGNVTPKVLLNEVELRGLVSFVDGEMGCV